MVATARRNDDDAEYDLVSTGIDVAELSHVRLQIKRHIEANGTLSGLDIEATKPQRGTPFAFAHTTPRLPDEAKHDKSLWYRCSYCEREDQFMDGRMVYCADKRIRLIGLDCWKKHIEEHDWRTADKEWKRHRRRERFEKLRGEIYPAAMTFQNGLRDLPEAVRAAIYNLEEFPRRARKTMPDLVDVLARFERTGGDLSVERTVERYGALEGRAGQRAVQDDDDASQYEVVPVRIHRLQGGRIFDIPPGSIGMLLSNALSSLQRATHWLRITNWEELSDQTFVRRADDVEAQCKEAILAVSAVLRWVAVGRAFMSATNLTGIAKWANDPDNEISFYDRWEAVPNGIRRHPDRSDPVDLVCPANFDIPEIPGMSALWRLFPGYQPREDEIGLQGRSGRGRRA